MTVAAREAKFGAQTLVRGVDFVKKRGPIFHIDRHGLMACADCGQRWRIAIRDDGFYAPRAATCPRCGAGH